MNARLSLDYAKEVLALIQWDPSPASVPRVRQGTLRLTPVRTEMNVRMITSVRTGNVSTPTAGIIAGATEDLYPVLTENVVLVSNLFVLIITIFSLDLVHDIL